MKKGRLLVVCYLGLLLSSQAFAQVDSAGNEIVTPKSPRPWANLNVSSVSAVPLQKNQGYVELGGSGETESPIIGLAIPIKPWLSLQAAMDPTFGGTFLSFDGQLVLGKPIQPASPFYLGASLRVAGFQPLEHDPSLLFQFQKRRTTAMAIATYKNPEFSVTMGLGTTEREFFRQQAFFNQEFIFFQSDFYLRWMPTIMFAGAMPLLKRWHLASEVHVGRTPNSILALNTAEFARPPLQIRSEVGLRYFGRRIAFQVAIVNDGGLFFTPSQVGYLAPDIRIAYAFGKKNK